MCKGAPPTIPRVSTPVADPINAQLVFPTFALAHFWPGRDSDLLYGGTEALNRAMVAFCAPDQRLKPVGFLPLNDPVRAAETLTAGTETAPSEYCGVCR